MLTGGPALLLLPLDRQAIREPFLGERIVLEGPEVAASKDGDSIVISVNGRADQVEGGYTLRVGHDATLDLSYQFTCLTACEPRQIGMVLELPVRCDKLLWRRRGDWTVYPEFHIGRTEGMATAFRDPAWGTVPDRERPPWPWALDQNALGSNDFRSTKFAISDVALTDANGRGVRVVSDDQHQSSRAWVETQHDRIALLVAVYSNSGHEFFVRLHADPSEYLSLHPSDVIEDTITCRLIDAK